MDAPKVTLRHITATLVRPSPLAALAIVPSEQEAKAMDRAEWAARATQALVECWPRDVAWPCLPVPSRWRPGQRVGDLGREAYDGLVLSGLSVSEILTSIEHAIPWMSQSLLTQTEVQEARDFCVAPTGG